MQSISSPNVVLNTAVAESLRQYADTLETAENFDQALRELLKTVIAKHRRIIFNGNNYGKEWEEEAERRGLLNMKALPDCAACYLQPKNISLFTTHRVFTEAELKAHYEIKLSTYSKVVNIEALTMLNISRRELLPAVSRFSGELAKRAAEKQALNLDNTYEMSLAARMSELLSKAYLLTAALGTVIKDGKQIHDAAALARYSCDTILVAMRELRAVIDKLERMTDREAWPVPVYGDILFSV